MIKNYFITGLVILLPLALTIAIVIFIFNLLTVPFLGAVNSVFDHYHLFKNGFLLLSPEQVQNLFAQILILISLFFICISLGIIASRFFFNALIDFTDYLVQKIPVVSSIYKTCQEMINTIFNTKTNSFKQVVLVKFPDAFSYAPGFITSEEIEALKGTPMENSVAVFIPTAPNPTSGFLVLYKKEDLVYLDMKVEDAFKFIISCGIIAPPFQIRSEPETLPENTHGS